MHRAWNYKVLAPKADADLPFLWILQSAVPWLRFIKMRATYGRCPQFAQAPISITIRYNSLHLLLTQASVEHPHVRSFLTRLPVGWHAQHPSSRPNLWIFASRNVHHIGVWLNFYPIHGSLLTEIAHRLYGLTVHQAFRYYRIYRQDVPRLRGLVSFELSKSTSRSCL